MDTTGRHPVFHSGIGECQPRVRFIARVTKFVGFSYRKRAEEPKIILNGQVTKYDLKFVLFSYLLFCILLDILNVKIQII